MSTEVGAEVGTSSGASRAGANVGTGLGHKNDTRHFLGDIEVHFLELVSLPGVGDPHVRLGSPLVVGDLNSPLNLNHFLFHFLNFGQFPDSAASVHCQN